MERENECTEFGCRLAQAKRTMDAYKDRIAELEAAIKEHETATLSDPHPDQVDVVVRSATTVTVVDIDQRLWGVL